MCKAVDVAYDKGVGQVPVQEEANWAEAAEVAGQVLLRQCRARSTPADASAWLREAKYLAPNMCWMTLSARIETLTTPKRGEVCLTSTLA